MQIWFYCCCKELLLNQFWHLVHTNRSYTTKNILILPMIPLFTNLTLNPIFYFLCFFLPIFTTNSTFNGVFTATFVFLLLLSCSGLSSLLRSFRFSWTVSRWSMYQRTSSVGSKTFPANSLTLLSGIAPLQFFNVAAIYSKLGGANCTGANHVGASTSTSAPNRTGAQAQHPHL